MQTSIQTAEQIQEQVQKFQQIYTLNSSADRLLSYFEDLEEMFENNNMKSDRMSSNTNKAIEKHATIIGRDVPKPTYEKSKLKISITGMCFTTLYNDKDCHLDFQEKQHILNQVFSWYGARKGSCSLVDYIMLPNLLCISATQKIGNKEVKISKLQFRKSFEERISKFISSSKQNFDFDSSDKEQPFDVGAWMQEIEIARVVADKKHKEIEDKVKDDLSIGNEPDIEMLDVTKGERKVDLESGLYRLLDFEAEYKSDLIYVLALINNYILDDHFELTEKLTESPDIIITKFKERIAGVVRKEKGIIHSKKSSEFETEDEKEKGSMVNEKMEAVINEKMEAVINEKMEAMINEKMEAMINEKMEAMINEKMEAMDIKK